MQVQELSINNTRNTKKTQGKGLSEDYLASDIMCYSVLLRISIADFEPVLGINFGLLGF